MAFKSTKNSTGNQGTFFQDDEVCKHGDFIKSPPPQLFTTQSSWKKRCFTLCKSSERCYTLKYLKGQQIKGFIAIDHHMSLIFSKDNTKYAKGFCHTDVDEHLSPHWDFTQKDLFRISNIEIGISNYEKMTAVRKMFKCHPEEVLSINTESRDYYLIGKDRKQVEDWFTSLSSARMKAKEDGCSAQNQNPEAQRSKGRSLSSPPAFDETVKSTHEEIPSDCDEVEDPADDKQRPHSDPGSSGLPEQRPRHSSPTPLLPSLNNNSEKTSINQLLLDSDENTRAEEEDYYASPSSILAQLESELSKSDPPVQSHNPVENEDHLCMKLYVSMKPLLPEEKLQPTCRSDEFLTLPRSQENSIDLRNCKADGNQQQLMQSSTNKQLTQERKPNVSSLSVVQLSIIINKVTDDSQLQEVDICIPHADVSSNLTLIEAAGQICVSHWTGPYRLGCIFHHGDHIVAVNDLRTQSIDEVSLFVSRSRRKEVKLTVRRIPDSDIFHSKGCSCS